MIIYNWKAEFSAKELKTIEHHKLIKINGGQSVVAEMANALDRYEAILNEQGRPQPGHFGFYLDDMRKELNDE